MAAKIREIWASDRYTRELALIGDIRRLDEVMVGLDFTLARCPEAGQPTDNERVRAIEAGPWAGAQLLVYYAFDDEQVEKLSVVLVPPTDSAE